VSQYSKAEATIAQQQVYGLLQGLKSVSKQMLVTRGNWLNGTDPARTKALRTEKGTEWLLAFVDGSYLMFVPTVGTWVALHERWETPCLGQ